MSRQKFPPGWDEARVKRLIDHYDQMDDDAIVAEDEAAKGTEGQTLMVIPTELLPAVRELITDIRVPDRKSVVELSRVIWTEGRDDKLRLSWLW